MIYLDHNATTPLAPEALEAMLPLLQDGYGNPSSAHRLGQDARKAVERARAEVAALLGAAADEVVFTSCGSESNAAALLGAAHARFEQSRGRLRRVLTSRVEHDSIREAAALLERRGFSVDWVGVDRAGRIDPEEVREKLASETALVTIQLVNNEVGTVQPLRAIAALCRERGIPFHTDAVQAAGKIPVDVMALDVDLLSISAHKFNGPKGMGALYVRRGLTLQPLIPGKQEKNRRGGTLNAAGIAGMGAAARVSRIRLAENAARTAALRGRLQQGIRLAVEGAVFSGHRSERLPNTLHVCFGGVSGHELMIALDLEGVCVSAAPACSSGAAEPSHVLNAMGLPADLALGAVRFSLAPSNTEAEIDRVSGLLPAMVAKLRKVRAPA